MAQRIRQEDWDVVVIGGGAAGVAAAIAAARNGARTVLVDAGPMIGGEMTSGIPIDGCLSTAGEWVVGGVIRDLFAECERLGGYIGPINDYRSLNVVAVDPEIMKIAVVNMVHAAGVKLLLYTFAEDVVMQGGRVEGVIVLNKSQRTLLRAKTIIDCSGDGDIAAAAGAPFEKGDETKGDLQPVTMVFRMMGVDTDRLLDFVVANPENFGLAEYADKRMTVQQAAAGLRKQGLAKAFLVAHGPLMQAGIARGELYATSMIAVTPVSIARKEVSLNTTRIGHLDATKTDKLSGVLPDLLEQVWMCAEFMRRNVPGFEGAVFSGIAPRIGIRETRRIIGDVVLEGEDIMQARKREDGIGKGAHELDIHLAGTGHVRSTIKDGGSYDIPWGCLLPKGLANVMIAGRCLSSTREAHSSARVMGTCMAMGQATGTAAALCASANAWGGDVREIAVGRLRDVLRSQGAVLDGTL
jgi:hypothetical protein